MFEFNSYTDDKLKNSHFQFKGVPYPRRYKAIKVKGDNGSNQFVDKVKVYSFDNPDEMLALGEISEFTVNGNSFTDTGSLLESLNSILFNGGRADESASGSTEVESEDPYSAYLKELTN